MQLLTKTIDIEDELDTIETRIDDIETKLDARTDRAIELDPPSDEDEREEFGQIQAEVTELEGLLSASKGYRESIARAIDEWDGSEVVIRELSGSETRQIKDEAAKKADELGLNGYSDNVHETMFMKRTVESTPPGAPDPSDIGDLPNRLYDWLLTRADTLNTVGGFEVGNSSLRERMLQRKDAEPSDQNQTSASTPQT